MKTDFYTRILLTVIAANLTVITLKDLRIIPNAQAAPDTMQKANLNYGIVPLNHDGSIDVNIKSNAEALKVNIEQVGGFWVGGAALPVKNK